MKKRILSMAVALLMVLALVPASFAADGLIEDLITLQEYDAFGRAWIDASKLTVGEAYTIEYVVLPTADHNGGFRVRYSSGMGGDTGASIAHNDTENSAHSAATAQPDGFVTNQIPAQYPNDHVPTGVKTTLTVNFVLGTEIADLDPLYEQYIGFFGSQNNNEYELLSVTVYNSDGDIIGFAGEAASEDETETETSEAAAEELVWELTAAEIEELIASGKSTDNLQNAGDGINFLTVEGDSMVFAADRPGDYHSVDLKVKDMCEAGVEYTLIVEMTSAESATLKLGEAGSPYGILASEKDTTSATLAYTFKDPANNVRIQTEDTGAFTIVSAKLYKNVAAVTEPELAAEATATPSEQTFTIDGETKVPDAYYINGRNYFKIRDLASLLSGTDAQFEVGYDDEKGAIIITTGQSYTPGGNENGPKGTSSVNAKLSSDKVVLNGAETEIAAYKINNSNYFQLRQLGEALGFGVDYNAETDTAIVTTK